MRKNSFTHIRLSFVFNKPAPVSTAKKKEFCQDIFHLDKYTARVKVLIGVTTEILKQQKNRFRLIDSDNFDFRIRAIGFRIDRQQLIHIVGLAFCLKTRRSLV